MKYAIYDESGTLPDDWITSFHDEYEHGKRKQYSGQRVMFTMDLDERTTLSWLAPDPEYAKPEKADSPL